MTFELEKAGQRTHISSSKSLSLISTGSMYIAIDVETLFTSSTKFTHTSSHDIDESGIISMRYVSSCPLIDHLCASSFMITFVPLFIKLLCGMCSPMIPIYLLFSVSFPFLQIAMTHSIRKKVIMYAVE